MSDLSSHFFDIEYYDEYELFHILLQLKKQTTIDT